jgi:hypothetical protein
MRFWRVVCAVNQHTPEHWPLSRARDVDKEAICMYNTCAVFQNYKIRLDGCYGESIESVQDDDAD